MPDLCLHCERAPRENYLRLCGRCAAVRGIRRLYRRAANWTPEREARVQALVERAKRQEPLFDEPIQIKENAHEEAPTVSAGERARAG
jgi:hypothetical protein